MLYIKVALSIIMLFFANTSFAELKKIDELQYKFIEHKDGYEFSGKFFVRANDKCLMDIIYEPAHLKNILKNRYIIEVIGSNKDYYDIKYTYKNLFVEIESTYRKMLKLSENKVIFEVLLNEQKGIFLPRVLSSQGYYKIKQENDGYLLEYYQTCKIERGNIRAIYLFFAKNEAVRFLKDLKKYAERICH